MRQGRLLIKTSSFDIELGMLKEDYVETERRRLVDSDRKREQCRCR